MPNYSPMAQGPASWFRHDRPACPVLVTPWTNRVNDHDVAPTPTHSWEIRARSGPSVHAENVVHKKPRTTKRDTTGARQRLCRHVEPHRVLSIHDATRMKGDYHARI